MPFPLINPKCPRCKEKLAYIDTSDSFIYPPGIQIFKCKKCNKTFDNIELTKFILADEGEKYA